MKQNTSVLLAFLLMVVVGSVCRVMGFAPQIALAVFGFAVISDKKLALLLPLVSMLLSDVLYEVLYRNGWMEYGGFYEGQVTNYLLIAGAGLFGLMARSGKPASIVAAAVAAPTAYFFFSNLLVWMGGGGYQRPKTVEGLLQCFADALPFYRTGLVNTLIFAAILFGAFFVGKYFVARKEQLA